MIIQLAVNNSTRIPSDVAELNPMEQIPILEFVDAQTNETHVLTQSLAIIDFLEDVYPAHSVYPSTHNGGALLKARVKQVCIYIYSNYLIY